jgi:glycosyltransferase involved in cell wall biosynthesis
MYRNQKDSGISVVLPAHGASAYLFHTLNSISFSTLIPNELLLIDDGINSDVVKDVALRFPSVRILPNEGSGLVDALNTGIRNTRFDLVARIDADDLMEPERLEIQMRAFRNDPGLVLFGSQVTYINELGVSGGCSNYFTGDITDLTRAGDSCLLAHPSVMYKVEAVNTVGGYRKIFRVNDVDLAEDFDLWIRLSRVGRVVNSDQALTRYRQHGAQLSNLHRIPQEMSSIYISAVSKFEDCGRTAPSVSIHETESMNWISIKFVASQLGFRDASRYFIEHLAYKKLIGGSIRRFLTRLLRL